MIKPWNVNRASVLNLRYRRELQLFGIEGVKALNEVFLVDNASAIFNWSRFLLGLSVKSMCANRQMVIFDYSEDFEVLTD